MKRSDTELFKGRHFDQQVIIPVCQVVSGLQAEFTRLGGDDGRASHRTGAHNESEAVKKSHMGVTGASTRAPFIREPIRSKQHELGDYCCGFRFAEIALCRPGSDVLARGGR
jgi:hypothetical protein